MTPCKTIQNAVNHSTSGDLIQLAPGIFTENVEVNQSVTIQGDAVNGSTVNGNNAGTVFVIDGLDTSTNPLTASLSMLTITNGKAPFGAGIHNGGRLTVVRCTITGNTAPAPPPGSGFLSEGGGIGNDGNIITIINSTISGNSAQKGGGFSNIGSATFVNTTINGNTASVQGGGFSTDEGILNFTNTIIAGSLGGGDCVSSPGGMIGTNSHNLVQDGSCSPAISGDPKLGPLQNNGGPTFTHALLGGSPAIDAGDDTVLGSPFSLATDQRGQGFPRKAGLHVDIGAFEVQQVVLMSSFDTCLKDNSTGNLLQWNSTTGQYQFTRCSDGFMLTGTGVARVVNGIRTLTDFKTDRRISAGFNTGQLTGNAILYLSVTGGVWQTIQIVDTNPSATCTCGI